MKPTTETIPGTDAKNRKLISHRELLKRASVRLLQLAGIGGCALTAFTLLGGIAPVFDLTTHFPVQYFVGLAWIAVIHGILRKWRFAAVFGAAALINLLQIAPLFFGGPSKSERDVAADVTFMTVNVLRKNHNHEAVRRAIEHSTPDIVALLEVDQRWITAMADLERNYPHSIKEPRDHNFGMALYSRVPLKNAQVARFVPDGVLSIVAGIEIDGRSLTVVATHPVPPSSSSSSHERNKQLAALANFADQRIEPVVILGDLNTTPWNGHFKKLLSQGRLLDSGKGFGLQPTWPGAWLPKLKQKAGTSVAGPPAASPFDNFLFRIPIDHCLHSSELQTVDRVVGEYVGSDHLPLTIKLLFRDEER